MLAGFLEGEVHLGIRELNGGQSFSCLAQLNVRDDDFEILEWIVALLGIGSLVRQPARRTSKPQVQWRVVTRDDCRELVTVLTRFPLRGRKRREFDVWARAVATWSGAGRERRDELRRMKAELTSLRRYSPVHEVPAAPTCLRALWGYISGFLLAEGYLRLTESDARAVIHLRADDRPLLEMLVRASGLGKVRMYGARAPQHPTATWTIAARSELSFLASWLQQIGLPGRKGELARIWADGVGYVDRGHRRSVARRLAQARPYVAPVERPLLEVGRPDTAEMCRTALTSWAAAEPGVLSCGGYSRWRARNPGHPTRNTIALTFGSWHRALEAAGLGDRAARAPRPAGGEARRRQQRDAQRARIVAAVLRFEREHGRLPRALEFFRWRYEASVDAPTQGPVYRLFPGGWSEVLECARQAAGATV